MSSNNGHYNALANAIDLLRGNIAFGARDVVHEMNRVYYSVKQARGLTKGQGYTKYLVLEVYRELLKDNGLLTAIHRLIPAIIVAGIQSKDPLLAASLPETLPDDLCDSIAESANARGFAITKFDIKRVYAMMQARPKWLKACFSNYVDPRLLEISLRRPLSKVGKLTDAEAAAESNGHQPLRFPQFAKSAIYSSSRINTLSGARL